MKKQMLLFTLLLVGLFTGGIGQLSAESRAPLSGIYTINPSGAGDYTTISAAVNDLNTLGTNAPVTFKIAGGVYDEQVTINAFTRTGNADDLVIFKRRVPLAVVNWRYSAATAGDNWVIKLNGADYVSLQGLKLNAAATAPIGRLIVLENAADHNIIANNTLIGHLNASSSEGTLIRATGKSQFNTVDNNTLTNGYLAIRFLGLGNTNADRAIGNSVINNTIRWQSQGGVSMYNERAPLIAHNTIHDTISSSIHWIGIDTNGDLPSITHNTIDSQAGETGISISSHELTNAIYINNNMINMWKNSVGEGTYGIVLLGREPDFYYIYNNTVRIAGAGSTPLLLSNLSFSISHIQLINNLFINDGGGTAASLPASSAISVSDYNDFYTSGSILVSMNGVNYTDLAAFQAASGSDANSVEHPVTFVDTIGISDLHLSGSSDGDHNLSGTPLVTITDDIDGDSRHVVVPYMGADETATALIGPLNGFYTIDLAGGADYSTISEAVNALSILGSSGPVTFTLAAGTYSENVVINPFTRIGSPDDTVTFMPATPSSIVTWHTSSSIQGLLTLAGVDYIILQNLIFENTASQGAILILENGSDHNIIDNNTLIGWLNPNLGTGTLINVTSGKNQFNTISNNTLTNGFYAIDFSSPDSNDPADGNRIIGNTLSGQKRGGIHLSSQINTLIDHNTIKDCVASNCSWDGITVSGDDIEITNNIIDSQTTSSGIDLSSSLTANSQHLIANNIINLRGSDPHNGLTISANAVDIYYNTIHLATSDSDSAPVKITASTPEVKLQNNLLLNEGGGLALYLSSYSLNTMLMLADYNNFYTTGSSLVRIGGTFYTDLAAYQTASGFDTNSAETSVTFVDTVAGNFHLAGASIGDPLLEGVPLPSITTDVDGDTRSATSPYMGADEPTGTTPTAVGELQNRVAQTMIGLPLVVLVTGLLLLTVGVGFRLPPHLKHMLQ